jgi:GAF domain-containing protein
MEFQQPEFTRTAQWLREALHAKPLHTGSLYQICNALREGLPHYDWVGFYLVAAHQPELLVLGPYVGLPTEHTEIPFGRGVCGTSAVTQARMIVPDVSASDNYLACSLTTRAEWVEPILHNGQYVAQLDIDSHTLAPFTDDDARLLTWLCAELGQRWRELQ